MNGTPRGRTSRLKQRRTESRQEQNFPHFFNFFQKILILLFLIIFILHFLIIFILHLKVYIFCSFREEEEVETMRGGCWLSTRPTRRRARLSLLLRLNLSNQVPIFTLLLQMKHRALWWRNAGGYSANGNNRGGNLNFPPGANLPQGLCWPVMGSFHSVKQNNWTMGEKK